MTTLNTSILFSFKTWKMCLPNVFQFGVALLTKLEATIKTTIYHLRIMSSGPQLQGGFSSPFF